MLTTDRRFLKKHQDCVKSVRIRSYPGPYFLTCGLDTDQNNTEYGQAKSIFQKQKR